MYILISTLLIYADYVGFLVLGFQFIYGIIYYWISKDLFRLRRLLVSVLMIFFLYLPWFPVLYRTLKDSGANWMAAPTIFQIFGAFASVIGIQIDGNYPHVYMNRIIFIILSLFFFISLIISFRDKKNFNTLMTATCMIPIFMLLLSLFTDLHIFSERQISAFSPEFDIVLATGLIRSCSLFPKIKPRIVAGFVVATILCSAILMIGSMHFYYVTDTNEDWRDAARYVEDNIQSNDAILFDASFVRKPFEFYLNLNRFEVLGINRNLKSIELTVDPSKYNNIWIILSHTEHGEQDYSKLLNNTKIKYDLSWQNFRGIKLLQFKIIDRGILNCQAF